MATLSLRFCKDATLKTLLSWDVTRSWHVVNYRRFRTASPLGLTGCPKASVTTYERCVTCQKSKHLIYTAAEASNYAFCHVLHKIQFCNSVSVFMTRLTYVLKNPKEKSVFNANKHVDASTLFGYIPYFSGVCLLQPVLDEGIYSSLD